MTALELARLVAEMRRAQRAYFRMRTPAALDRSKQLERELDRAVEEIVRGPYLFKDEG
jgi:hypothetical protein